MPVCIQARHLAVIICSLGENERKIERERKTEYGSWELWLCSGKEKAGSKV